MTHLTTRVQDNDGHWYWISNDKFLQFNKDLEAITGIEYMDNPDAFDKFEEDYGVYATGGAPDLMPDIFNEEKIKHEKEVDKIQQMEQDIGYGSQFMGLYDTTDSISQLSELYESQKDLIHSCVGIPAKLQGDMLDGLKKMRDMCATAMTKN